MKELPSSAGIVWATCHSLGRWLPSCIETECPSCESRMTFCPAESHATPPLYQMTAECSRCANTSLFLITDPKEIDDPHRPNDGWVGIHPLTAKR